MINRISQLALLACLAMMAACTSTTVTTTAHTPLEQEQATVPESQLLDVGVIPFDPGLEKADPDDETLMPEVRNAEGRYLALNLSNTIQRSAGWGAVRIVPSPKTVTDVYIEGTIIHSDGERLTVEIKAFDSSGGHWYTKEYEEVVGKYAYERRNRGRDPFQGIYNRIANDLLDYKQSLPPQQAEQLRTISELRFARDFSPQAFDEYLSQNKDGELNIEKLPAANDPLLARIERIRSRDYLYIDNLQEHYHTFVKRMETPYQEWRSMSYDEVIEVRKLKKKATTNTIAGIGLVLAGVAGAASSNSSGGQAAGIAGIGGGGILIKEGFAKRQEAQIHIDTLNELGTSLEGEIEPQIIELEDRTITLTGSVEAQYEQWKGILREIYEQERGE